MRKGTFNPLVLFWTRFFQLKKLSKLIRRWKLTSIRLRVNLTPCQAHWVWWRILLGGAKGEHFFCFLNSCQLAIRVKLLYFMNHHIACFDFNAFCTKSQRSIANNLLIYQFEYLLFDLFKISYLNSDHVAYGCPKRGIPFEWLWQKCSCWTQET